MLPIRHGLTLLWLALVGWHAIDRLRQYYLQSLGAVNSDAQYTYLPAARGVLEHGWHFLTSNPLAYRVAPLGYMWPALWQGNETWIRLANAVLFLACIGLTWRIATRLGGWVAGVISTLLLVKHPGLGYYVPKVMTEPIYLFGFMLMVYAAVEFFTAERRIPRFVVLGALGLTITLLSRPALQLMTLALLLTGTILVLLGSRASVRRPATATPGSRLTWRGAVLALALACIVPAAVTIKNGVHFGVWGLATGTGAGLYYGLHPLTGGIEPDFAGFGYDIGEVVATADPATHGEPLLKRADEIERKVALSILANTALPDQIAFLARKAYYWLSYSTPELVFDHKLRRYRLIELAMMLGAGVLLVVSWWRRGRNGVLEWLHAPAEAGGRDDAGAREALARRRGLMLLCLLAGFGTMWVQLTPLLYNTRYNSFFLEPWLILLAGASAAILMAPLLRFVRDVRAAPSTFWQRAPSVTAYAACCILLAAAPSSLTALGRKHESFSVNAERPGPTETMLKAAVPSAPQEGLRAAPNGRWILESSPATLTVPLPEHADDLARPMNALWVIRLGVQADAPESCRTVHMSLTNPVPGSIWIPPLLRLHPDGQVRELAIHGNKNLRPAGAGALQLRFECPAGTVIEWHGATLLRSTLPEAARALVQQQQPIDPYLSLPR